MAYLLDSDITYDSFVQQNLCRLCWDPIEGETWLKSELTTNDLYEKVLNCIGIDLHEIMVPNKICDLCIQKLETFSTYKTSCINANEKLRSIFEKHVNSLDCKLDDIKPEPSPACSEIKSDIDIPPKLKVKKKVFNENKITKKRSNYKAKRSSTYCNICHIDLKSLKEYTKHNIEAHGIEENGSVFKCFGCDRRFSTRKSRLSHERNFCRGLQNGYKCTICDKYLQSRGNHESHIRMHNSNKTIELGDKPGFNCKQCSHLFNDKAELDTHKLLVHAPVKRNYICEQCGQIFHRVDYLRKHRMIHGDIKNYNCTLCEYTTRQKSSLIVHIRKHTGERPFSCDLCDLKCVSSSNLLAHRRRHLGVKDYECALCLKRFGYKSSLQDHMVSIHGQGDAMNRSFCELCGAVFPRLCGLKRHMRTKHKVTDKNTKTKEVQEIQSIV